MFTVFKADWNLDRKYSTLSHFACLHFWTLIHLAFFTGMRLTFYSGFSHKLVVINSEHRLFTIPSYLLEWFDNFKVFFNSLWDLELWDLDCELASQTVSLMVKLWELEGIPHFSFLLTYKASLFIQVNTKYAVQYIAWFLDLAQQL